MLFALKKIEGLGAFVVNAEGRRFYASVQGVFNQTGLGPHQILGCVVFKVLVRM